MFATKIPQKNVVSDKKKQKQKTHFKTKSIIKRRMFTAIKNQKSKHCCTL